MQSYCKITEIAALSDQLISYLLFFQPTAISRLAAAHRGAFRALQAVIHQLSDLSHVKVPPYYKELGQLIRQLSLCSAKVEVERGSTVPETALDILQKLEVRSTKYSPAAFTEDETKGRNNTKHTQSGRPSRSVSCSLSTTH